LNSGEPEFNYGREEFFMRKPGEREEEGEEANRSPGRRRLISDGYEEFDEEARRAGIRASGRVG
jgi:hypothetical protein